MSENTAIRPDFFNNLPSVIKDKKAKALGVTDEELELYALSGHGGWKRLSGFIDELVRDLDKGTESAMTQGLPFEEIGRNAVVINLAKGVINRIVQKVEDAKDACERSDGTTR